MYKELKSCQNIFFAIIKEPKYNTERYLNFGSYLATNAIFDTGCIGLQSCIEMQPKKHMQPTDKLEFFSDVKYPRL